MKLYIYANFNNLGGFFGQFATERIEPQEMVENYAQVVCGLDKEYLFKLKECDLYCLGSFDNVTGEIIPEKSFLLHCGEVASRILGNSKDEESEEVKDE